MRLIDADVLVYQLEKQKTIDGQPRAIGRALRVVENTPTIESEPVKHGRWKYFEEIGAYSCSECHRYQYGNTLEILQGEYNYCPNCGADMREAEE